MSDTRRFDSVAGDVRDLARIAVEDDGKALVGAALKALGVSLPGPCRVYLSWRGGHFQPRLIDPPAPLPRNTLEVEDFPILRDLFDEGRAVRLDVDRWTPLAEALVMVCAEAAAAPPAIAVPIQRGETPEGLLFLTGEPGGETHPSELEVATVYGSLIGLGLAAVRRAERLEQLREALQERNELLAEEISGDADACRSLDASQSRVMRRLVQMAKQVASTDAPVLVTGETGTGKEVLARAIHEWSPRAGEPFVQLNCAALSDQLIESELFGHVEGAFSGAVGDRAGRFRVADGGTLLLDEIGEMPLDAQTKLLRVLEEGEVVPVGSDEPTYVDVRVIAATNVDLELAIDRGRFREDLYFRLHVFPLHLPPLRDRMEDLPVLVDQILARIRRRTGHGPWRIPDSVMKGMRAYAWPGNVRELVNALERARVFSPLGGSLLVDVGADGGGDGRGSRRRRRARTEWPSLAAHQKTYIEEVLERTRGKIYGEGGAAEILGLPPSTLQSRMKKLGVEKPRSP